jgi:hypothetical protein
MMVVNKQLVRVASWFHLLLGSWGKIFGSVAITLMIPFFSGAPYWLFIICLSSFLRKTLLFGQPWL